MLNKVGKVIAKANVKAAQFEAQAEIKHQLDSIKVIRKRIPVQFNSNEKFSDLNSIKGSNASRNNFTESIAQVEQMIWGLK